jgi:hypothetical protein
MNSQAHVIIGDVKYPVTPYGAQHQHGSRCPECGGVCWETCMGPLYGKDGTVNTNKAGCESCGWRGHSFELVSRGRA